MSAHVRVGARRSWCPSVVTLSGRAGLSRSRTGAKAALVRPEALAVLWNQLTPSLERGYATALTTEGHQLEGRPIALRRQRRIKRSGPRWTMSYEGRWKNPAITYFRA